MPKPKSHPANTDRKYVQMVRHRKKPGVWYSYYRRNGKRLLIEGQPGTADWHKSYEEIHAGFEQPEAVAPRSGSLQALINLYKTKPRWLGLKPTTQEVYDLGLRYIVEVFGAGVPVTSIDRKTIVALRDRTAKQRSDRAAIEVLKVMRRLMAIAMDDGWITFNPMADPIDKPYG